MRVNRQPVRHCLICIGLSPSASKSFGAINQRRDAPVSERHVENKFEGPKFRTISWPEVAAALATIAGGTAVLMIWLLAWRGRSWPALDAVRTAFTVGLAAGGTLALLLAARRQWLQERERMHAEFVAADTADRAERIATATERDATEWRMTELYVKASDQLGSAKAAVRLVGLFALERLGRDNPGQRQVVVKVITAYLRMPLSPAELDQKSDDRSMQEAADSLERLQEVEVRKAAQQILADHLNHQVKTHDGTRSTSSTYQERTSSTSRSPIVMSRPSR
jgi:hypothetical protein